MPIPHRLRELAGTAEFWSDYFGDDVFGNPISEPPAEAYIDLPLAAGYVLRVGFLWKTENEVFTQSKAIHLRRTVDGNEWLLGWYDSHSHQHVLRWEEIDLISRYVAAHHPEVLHPGIPYLLLTRYVASIAGSDHTTGLRLLNTALRSLGVFSDGQIRFRLSQYQCVPAECDWQQVESFGWVCHFLGKFFFQGGGKCIHSLRCTPYEPPIPLPEPLPRTSRPEFPFVEWNECVEAMTRELAELGSPAVVLAAAVPLHPAPPWTLCYQVPYHEPAYATVPAVKRILFEEGFGVCHLTGCWSAFENQTEWQTNYTGLNPGDEFEISGHGELETAVPVIRRIVEESGHSGIRLFQRFPFGSQPPYRRLF